MTRHREFITAAARRRADPIVWTIDGQEIHLRAAVDVTELGGIVETLQVDVEGETGMAAVARRRRLLLDAVEMCVVTEDVESFRAMSDSLDLAILAEMAQEVVAEYSGAANPTKAPSSSDGSSPTGDSSTAGALPVA